MAKLINAKCLSEAKDVLFKIGQRKHLSYEPTGLQEDLILAVGSGKNKIIVAFDANRVGKTTTIINIAKNIFWPCDDKWFAWWKGDSIFKNWPFPEKSFRITGTPTNCADNGPIQSEIAKWWPADKYTQDRAGKHYYSQIKTDSGWNGDVMTYEQAPEEYEGKTLSLVLSDEPPRPALFGAIASRLMQGIWIIGATPVNCGILVDLLDEIKERGSPVCMVTGSITENHKDTGKFNHLNTKRGLWSSQEIDQYVATIPMEQRAARLGGICSNKSGKIFPMFRDDVHLIDFNFDLLPQCNCYMSIDPHRKYYPAITWYAVTPAGITIQYNEYPKYEDLGCWYDEARNTINFDKADQLANIILANDYSAQYGAKIIARAIDPRFLNENPTFLTPLIAAGVTNWVHPDCEKIEIQRVVLQGLMNFNPNMPLVGSNLPSWYLDKTCKNSRRMYIRHCWDTDKDKEDETYKDIPDSARYFLNLLNGKPEYREQKEQTGTSEALANFFELRTKDMFYKQSQKQVY